MIRQRHLSRVARAVRPRRDAVVRICRAVCQQVAAAVHAGGEQAAHGNTHRDRCLAEYKPLALTVPLPLITDQVNAGCGASGLPFWSSAVAESVCVPFVPMVEEAGDTTTLERTGLPVEASARAAASSCAWAKPTLACVWVHVTVSVWPADAAW